MLKHSGELKFELIDRGEATQIQWIVDRRDGAPNFELRKFRIGPGGRIPRHYHPDIEHEQYVLEGNYTVGIGDRIYQVKPGDALFIPAGTPHWYENRGGEEIEFLCIVPKKESYKTVYTDDEQSPNSSPRRC